MISKFRTRLRYLIDQKKISQAAFARGINVNSARVTGWLKGDVKKPQRTTLLKICDFFGCELEWLATGNGEPFCTRTTEPTTPHVRNYREISELDSDILKEIQTWINDMEVYRPGSTAWFRLEFQNRFPEFDDWKMKQFKKAE